MPKITVKKESNYTTIDNNIFRNKNLSLKARGLLATMLSFPEEWDYTVAGLCSILKDGKSSIQSGLKELEETGYLVRTQTKDPSGRFSNAEYILYESPLAKKPLTVDMPAENPTAEEQPQLNTNILNTKNNAFSKEKETGSEVQYPAPASIPKYTYTPEQLYTCLSVKLNEFGKGMKYYKEYKIKELVDIVIYFHKKFKHETGMDHPVLSDDSYRTIVREFLDPPEITRFYCLYNYDDYKKLIDLYFNENYGNYGEITKYISHFMSDEIRENLAKKIFIDT